jgi:CHASE3 domain sensor protein
MIEDERLRAAVQRCAKLEAWLKLEPSDSKRIQIEQQLATAKDAMWAEVLRVKQERVRQEAAQDRGRVREINYPRR